MAQPVQPISTEPRGTGGSKHHTYDGELDFARSILCEEGAAVQAVAEGLDASFSKAVELLTGCADSGGTVLVSGLGKSGLIGAKISATLASLGIPSHSVHPAEAAHGDLGRIRPTDTVIAISFSGETDEVVNLAAILRQDGIPVVSITRRPKGGDGDDSAPPSLVRLATVPLFLPVEREAGGADSIAPTSSTTATLALGDALALCVARRRNFTPADFAKHHPGGALGGLLKPVTEVLRFVASKNLPLIPHNVTVRQALEQAAAVARRPGAMILVDPANATLSGIFTDGDLRRLVLRGPGELARPITEVMTRSPRTLPDTALVRDAVRLIREFRQDEIPVVDALGRPVGVLDVQDLIAMRLVKD